MARRREHEPNAPVPIFFIDRCLGSTVVAEALRNVHADVRVHDAEFRADCPDEEWITEVASRGWTILTKDRAIRRRRNEVTAIETARAAAFILTAGDVDGPGIAQAFVAALPRMIRLLETHTRPLIATVSRSGTVTLNRGERHGGIRKDERG